MSKGVNYLFAGGNAVPNDNGGCEDGTSPYDLILSNRNAPNPNKCVARHSISFEKGFMSPSSGDNYLAYIDPSKPECIPLSTGLDGNPLPTNTNAGAAKNAFGFSLNYFEGDYKPIGSTAAGSLLTPLGVKGLYNGNIAAMSVNIPKLGDALVYKYGYDQLNRIVSMDAYRGIADNGVS